MKMLDRRAVLRGFCKAAFVAALLPVDKRSLSMAADKCENGASEGLRTELHYTDKFATAAQTCVACAFFTSGAAPCGDCMIMSGSVNQNGHCDSWAAKS